ncbi:MAG TPA: hypothetical protein VEF55_12940 [Candidatus Binatia bacterium]|nr:hypothetical protein [Candidatus Binatia bacterium]
MSRRRFWKDLTRTRHMTAVSAVVLGTTFMPLLGVPDIYELRAFQSAVEGFSDARAEVLAPRRNDEAARERSSRSVINERDRRDDGSQEGGADRMLTVERPEHEPAEMFDAAEILPLPPLDEPALAAPVEEDMVLPEVVEEVEPDAPPAAEDEIMDEEKPAAEEEEAL